MSDDAKQLLERYQPKPLKVIEPDRQLCALRYSPCGKFLAGGGSDATVRRWDATSEEYRELPRLAGHHGWVQSIAFHPDPAVGLLFSVDSWGELRAWPYAPENPQPTWAAAQAHDGWIRGIAVRADGQQVATCGRDRAVRVWSSSEGKKLAELTGHAHDVYAVAFHPDGQSLVSGDERGLIHHWDLASGQPKRQFDASAMYKYDRIQDVSGLRVLVFDSAGKKLYCGGIIPHHGATVQGLPTVMVFDWESGQLEHTLKLDNQNDGHVLDLAVHADGFVMGVTSGVPGSGKFFFQRPGDEKPFFVSGTPNSHALAVHPEGRRLAVSATNTGSNGNGRQLGPNGEYKGNFSPIHLFELPQPA